MHLAFIYRPVSGYSIALFRILFGLLLVIEAARFLVFGWIDDFYLQPAFLFKYYGFEWVGVWPGNGLHIHIAVMLLSGIGIMLGAFYRLSCILHFFLFAYLFLLDQARYLNHFYLVLILNFLLCLIPAHQCWSVDRWRNRLKGELIPHWCLLLLKWQMEIVLVYAGLVKINHDWLNGQPLFLWFGKRHDTFLGPLLTQDWFVYFASYFSIALHLIGAPLLFWRKTRIWVFLCYLGFHLSNHFVWSIGIFPWMTIAGTLLFFNPDWPHRLYVALRTSTSSPAIAPNINNSVPTASTRQVGLLQKPLIVFAGLFLILQIVIPLRHYMYPGNVAWNEEGHRFSWRMKLRTKSGTSHFLVVDKNTGQRWQINPRDYLLRKQHIKMTKSPDMILQFAHFLAQEWRKKGIEDPQVYARILVSLNGRERQSMIDPDTDLAAESRHIGHNQWITSLPKPLQTTWF